MIRLRHYVMLALLFTSISVVEAQHTYFDSLAQAKSYRYDSIRKIYVREFHDRINIKPIFTARSLQVQLEEQERQVSEITYKPSSSSYFGLGFYLFDLNLELSFKLPQNEESTPSQIYGKTRSFDFQTNIYAKKWGADIAYQRYNGMYLDNTDRHFNDWQEGEPFIIRDDLIVRYFQLNTFYFFNHDQFSFRSPYLQSEQQLKSAGSFLVNILISTFRFGADSTLIPESAKPFFPQNEGLQRARVTTLAIMPGYSYTYTYRNFYVNASLSIGPGHLWLKYNREGRDKEDISIQPVINARAAVGYNGDWFFTGLTGVNQFVSADVDNLKINSSSGNIKFFFGFRIIEKGGMKKKLF